MSEFLLWIIVLALVVKVVKLSNRLYALERRPVVHVPAPEEAPVMEPAIARAATAPESVYRPVVVPPPLPFTPEPQLDPEPVAYQAEPEPEPEQARKRAIDWESVLGTNLLNKLGVLLLLVGIALFLGYSLTVFGPGGRVAIGIATSLTILAAGVFAEKREAYAMFGRGLIGGGWAGLYFTTFAAYAIPAAQIIASPVLGTMLLMAVAAAMILHSLRYRSETVTGMAYLLSFLTLGISGAPVLAIIATLPLAVSVIYLSYRFAWPRLILGGLPIAYAVFFLQSQVANTASPELLKLMLLTYWIVFESAEVMRPSGTWLPFVLNGICFSFLAWGSPAIAASAYAASTAMRIKFGREYRGALTALSVLCGKAIFQHTTGLSTPVALLIEAELLFLASVRWKQSYVRYLATAAFVVAIPTLLVAVFEKRVDNPWLTAIVTTGVVMFVNFYLHRASWLFPWVGTSVLAIAIASEAPTAWLGVAWLALAGVLSFREEFRLQTRAMGAVAVAALGVINVAGFEQPNPLPWQPQLVAALMLFAGAVRSGYAVPAATAGAVMAATLMWNVLPAPLVALGWAALSLGLYETGFRRQGEAMALAAFGRLFFANFDAPDRMLTTTPVIALQYYLYSRGSRWFVYIGGIALATLIRFQAGHVMVVIGWAAMALACQAIGSLRDNRDFRFQAYLLAALTFVRCWTTNFYEPAVLARVWTGVIVIACLFAAHLISRRDRETFARPLFSTLASALLSVLLFFEVSGKVLTMAWAVEGAVLLAAGFVLRERHVRFTGLGLLAACVVKLFFYDFATLDTPYRIASFLLLGVLFIAGSWVYTRFRKQIEEAL